MEDLSTLITVPPQFRRRGHLFTSHMEDIRLEIDELRKRFYLGIYPICSLADKETSLCSEDV
jgi:hypothetical protein